MDRVSCYTLSTLCWEPHVSITVASLKSWIMRLCVWPNTDALYTLIHTHTHTRMHNLVIEQKVYIYPPNHPQCDLYNQQSKKYKFTGTFSRAVYVCVCVCVCVFVPLQSIYWLMSHISELRPTLDRCDISFRENISPTFLHLSHPLPYDTCVCVHVWIPHVCSRLCCVLPVCLCVYGGICQIVAEVKRSHLEDSARADPPK